MSLDYSKIIFELKKYPICLWDMVANLRQKKIIKKKKKKARDLKKTFEYQII